jgi:hypothetical protein
MPVAAKVRPGCPDQHEAAPRAFAGDLSGREADESILHGRRIGVTGGDDVPL